jgi:UDP-N-acetylmuramyl tripeptide synthase
MRPRTTAAVIAGKIARAASRLARRGGGTAVAGLVAQRIDPHIVSDLVARAGRGAVAVTGTNGKTTTSLMLNRIAVESGLLPLHNRSGSNLMRGLAAMLVAEASWSGEIPGAGRRLAILEVDEATLPLLLRKSPVRVAVFTNLFRDQLDRYGEVDAVAGGWEQALAAFDASAGAPPALVLNADDPAVAHLGRARGGDAVYYGIDDPAAGAAAVEHASDFRTCLDCGGELSYAVTYYGHVGHWRCPACGNERPAPAVRAVRVTAGEETTALEVRLPDGAMKLALPLGGLYNAYNALAAIAAAVTLGLPRDAVQRALEGFSAAFGRQERFLVDGRDVRVLLGKNPTGLNQVLRTVMAAPGEKRLLFVLNDGIADGRDVSWIWDADYELARNGAAPLTIAAGTRAADLALRLKYAGFDDVAVEPAPAAALARAIAGTPPGGRLYVLPTYTAMLELRQLLAKRTRVAAYWDAP